MKLYLIGLLSMAYFLVLFRYSTILTLVMK